MTAPGDRELTVETDDGAALATVVLAGRRRVDGSPGATVVLSHCWGGSRRIWWPVARRLRDRGCDVVLYDQRGHGASRTGRAGISLDRLGRDVAAVVEHLDLQGAVVAGHSMGGFSALAYAAGSADHRLRVRGLALVATAAHGLPRLPLPSVQAHLLGGFTTRLFSRERLGTRLARRAFGAEAPADGVDLTRELFAATGSRVRADCFRAFRDIDLREGLGGVDTPAVVVSGQHDALTPPQLGRALAESLPDATYQRLERRGHMLPLEAPDDVTAAIATLL